MNGRKFTGSNGGSVFLPAAGMVMDGKSYSVGAYGFYWSSTPYDEHYAGDLFFHSGDADWYDSDGRVVGRSVRPVR